MTGRPNKPVGQRDLKPANDLIEIVRRPVVDPARRARLVVVLRRVLDNHSTPDEPAKR